MLSIRPRKKLVMVHIGKCGGSSVRAATRISPVVQERYRAVERYHFSPPRYRRRNDYLFTVRNPISRAISAFNYRFYHLVANQNESPKHPRETEVLLKYGSMAALAEGLYREGQLDHQVENDFLQIHHLGDESFSFYLKPLVGKLRRDQVFGVFAPEFLAEELPRALAVEPPRKRMTAQKLPPEMRQMSKAGELNLRSYLAEDFVLLEKLIDLAQLNKTYRGLLLG